MKFLGYLLMTIGITIAAGPIAVYLLLIIYYKLFPSLIVDDLILGSGYLAAFGLLVYYRGGVSVGST
jgi:hypothetical protein